MERFEKFLAVAREWLPAVREWLATAAAWLAAAIRWVWREIPSPIIHAALSVFVLTCAVVALFYLEDQSIYWQHVHKRRCLNQPGEEVASDSARLVATPGTAAARCRMFEQERLDIILARQGHAAPSQSSTSDANNARTSWSDSSIRRSEAAWDQLRDDREMIVERLFTTAPDSRLSVFYRTTSNVLWFMIYGSILAAAVSLLRIFPFSRLKGAVLDPKHPGGDVHDAQNGPQAPQDGPSKGGPSKLASLGVLGTVPVLAGALSFATCGTLLEGFQANTRFGLPAINVNLIEPESRPPGDDGTGAVLAGLIEWQRSRADVDLYLTSAVRSLEVAVNDARSTATQLQHSADRAKLEREIEAIEVRIESVRHQLDEQRAVPPAVQAVIDQETRKRIGTLGEVSVAAFDHQLDRDARPLHHRFWDAVTGWRSSELERKLKGWENDVDGVVSSR